MLHCVRSNRFACRRTTPPRGFTLIELVVVVAVLAILATVAVPSFTTIAYGNRLTAVANDLVGTLQAARMEALRRGQQVIVCRSDDGSSCSTGASWNGWVMFADADGNGSPASAEILRVQQPATDTAIWASSNVASGSRVVFHADGLAYSNASLLLDGKLAVCIETAHPSENVRDVAIGSGGRINVSRRSGNGACAAPDNS